MSLKEKSRKELEKKIEELETVIHKKGIGSSYLSKAERIQRDINLALILGGAATLVGAAAWTLLRSRGD
jgi:hypothetical protein